RRTCGEELRDVASFSAVMQLAVPGLDKFEIVVQGDEYGVRKVLLQELNAIERRGKEVRFERVKTIPEESHHLLLTVRVVFQNHDFHGITTSASLLYHDWSRTIGREQPDRVRLKRHALNMNLSGRGL